MKKHIYVTGAIEGKCNQVLREFHIVKALLIANGFYVTTASDNCPHGDWEVTPSGELSHWIFERKRHCKQADVVLYFDNYMDDPYSMYEVNLSLLNTRQLTRQAGLWIETELNLSLNSVRETQERFA